MARTIYRSKPLTIALDDEAHDLLRVMARSPKNQGRLITSLVLAEVARREQRSQDRAAFTRMLQDADGVRDAVALVG